MYFSDEQTKLLDFISQKDKTTIYEILVSVYEYNIITIDVNDRIKNKNVHPIDQQEDNDVLLRIAKIYSFCEYLQQLKLINIYDTGDIYMYNDINEFFNKNSSGYGHSGLINKKLKDYSALIIIPFKSLNLFIKNGYKTSEELELLEERKSRKSAELFTKIIAIFSIIVSLFTIIFNYITYSKEREMIIKNPGEINYPVEIKNIEKYIELQEKYILKIEELININV
jgi:hypothetical protein